MTTFEIVKWVHLLGAAVWTGGLIVLGFLVTAIRKVSDDRAVLQASARRFAVVSWSALAVALISGTWMYTEYGLPWRRFEVKGGLIFLAVVLAAVHQFTAKRTSAKVRGMIQAAVLVVSIAIFGAAVTLV